MKKILFVFIFLSFAIAQASGGGGHHETGVPMGTVMSQLVNLGLLIAILFFWQGKNIANAFAQKKENFLKSVEEANSAKKEAENKLKEVEHRLQELLDNYKKSVDEAKKNAEESYRTQVSNARNDGERIKTTAQNSLESEIHKQIENLRVETFKKSAEKAEKELTSHLTPDQQKAWNQHFANSTGVH